MKINTTTCDRRGFTLIEILVTIGIIALLAGILVPGIGMALKAANKSKTLASVRMIEGGAKQYANDFDGEFPPSDSTARSDYNLNSGAKIICAFVTGYAGDMGTQGTPGDNQPNDMWRLDDGKDGMGFRVKTRGPVHGPYNSCDAIPMNPDIGSYNTDKTARVFIDAWDNPILYYRANDSGDRFDEADNSSEDPTPKSSPDFLDNYNNAAEEFLILSSGGKSSYSDVDDAISNINE